MAWRGKLFYGMSFCQAKHLQSRQTLANTTWSVLMQSGHFGDVSKAQYLHTNTSTIPVESSGVH